MESGIREIFVSEFGILGFGVWNRAQGIRNPTNDSNPESAGSIDKVFGRNPVPGIRNPWPGTGSDSHTFYGLVKGSSVFFATFSVVISASQEILFIITISTLLILAVRRTHVIQEPCIWPNSPFVAQWLEHPTGSITGGDSYSFCPMFMTFEPWGTPDFNTLESDKVPAMLTHCRRSNRLLLNHSNARKKTSNGT